MDCNCLWTPPDQAGWLEKQSHSSPHTWHRRFFILKGQYLFYFKDRKKSAITKLHAAIPLENAKVETVNTSGDFLVTVTVHAASAWSARHQHYVLAAPNSEVQAAWVAALWQAAIPRHELINVLHQAGKLPEVVDSYARTVMQCYPVADAAVLSTAGTRGKLSFLGNMGTLAGALRKARAKGDSIFGSIKDLPPHKAQAARDGGGKRLPAALQDPVSAAEVLARAASSTPTALATAAAGAVRLPSQGQAPVSDHRAGISTPAAAAAALPEAAAPAPVASPKLPPGQPNIPDTPTAAVLRGAAGAVPTNTPAVAPKAAGTPAATGQLPSALAGITLPPGVYLDNLATADLAQLDSLLQALAPAQQPAQQARQAAQQKPATATDTGNPGIRWATNPLANDSTPSSPALQVPRVAADATVTLGAAAHPPTKPAAAAATRLGGGGSTPRASAFSVKPLRP